MITGGLEAFKGRRILLLQGPVGPFFKRLSRDLEWAGASVCKINFNGGDWIFFRDTINFRGSLDDWPAFLESVLLQREIDLVLLFGDCRPIHRLALEVLQMRNVEFGVFEEGYLRPNHVTLERHGVNGHSQLPTSPMFYLHQSMAPTYPVYPVGNTFRHAAFWAVCYYVAAQIFRFWFPKYEHHRAMDIREAGRWLFGFAKKAWCVITELGVQRRLCGPLRGKYFLVPLQVYNDAQIHAHSPFASTAGFIQHVVHSFAHHAPPEAVLVFKQHPFDRPYSHFGSLLRRLGDIYGVADRLMLIHDQHLPSLLAASRAVIVVNSTVGMSALDTGRPVKVCGHAVYDMPGLTFQGSLDDFWTRADAAAPDRVLFEKFRDYVVDTTQLNGSFYRRLDLPGSHSGLAWRARSPRAVPTAEPAVCTARGISGVLKRRAAVPQASVEEEASVAS